jgi:16S rRNA (cytidine1402-2'-O)-methyltransferase
LVLFESGPRLGAALADLAAGLGPRPAAICRELTKLHEEIRRADLESLARHYEADAETRGEIVIVVAPPADDAEKADDVDDLLRRALKRVTVKDAVGEVALATGRPRREVYQRALALANSAADKDDGDGAP